MEYYRLLDDLHRPRRWFLGSPTDARGKAVDAATFLDCARMDLREPLRISVRKGGEPLDFTLADFDMPVLAQPFVEALRSLAGDAIQAFSSSVADFACQTAVLNVLQAVDCIDEGESEFDKWEEKDGEPDLVGRYKTVTRLKLLRSKIVGRTIFRVRGWESALVVNGNVMSVLARAKGVVFEPV